MAKNKLTRFIGDQKQHLTAELLYQLNKNKGVTKDFIELLYYHNCDGALKLLNKAKSKNEFIKLLRDNIDELRLDKSSNMFVSFLTGGILGKFYNINGGFVKFINFNLAKMVLGRDIEEKDTRLIYKKYKSVLLSYIKSHNIIRNKFENNDDSRVSYDFTKDLTEEEYDYIVKSLFMVSGTDKENNNKEVLFELLVNLFAVYDKETLLNNMDLVVFEMESGYFDKYCELIKNNKKIPALDERQKRYNGEKKLDKKQRYLLTQVELLKNRIALLSSSKRDFYLQKLEISSKENDLVKKARIIQECYEYYEQAFREEIIEKIYTPTESKEITDFAELQTVLVHVFYRPYALKKKKVGYEQRLKEEILSRRGIKVVGDEELTEEEMKEYQEKMDYAIRVLLNPVVAGEALDEPAFYSDSSGLRWYKSNPSNQLSTSIMSPYRIINMSNCIGIGFGSMSLSPDNIAMSSKYYQTTNMGLDRLEINPEDTFSAFSAPLKELEDGNNTEVVLYRNKNGKKITAAYVFAVVTGYNKKQDEETIESARKYAEDNGLKLIVFNTLKLKESYEKYITLNGGSGELERKKSIG